MVKSKAIDLIKTFSDEEQKRFAAFLRSPYFNTAKAIVKLYDALRKNFSVIETLTEDYLFKKAYPGKKYNYNMMKNLLSGLHKLAEEFLIVNAGKRDYNDINSAICLLEEYEKRMPDNIFKTKFQKAALDFGSRKIDRNFDRNLAELNDVLHRFYHNRSDSKNEYSVSAGKLQYHFGHTIYLLFLQALNILTTQHSANKPAEANIIKLFLKDLDFDSFFSGLKESYKGDKTHLVIWMQSIALFLKENNKNNDTLYYELKDNILKNLNRFSNYDLNALLNTVLTLYCEIRTTQGAGEFFNERYEIQKVIFSNVKFRTEGVGPLFLHTYIDFISLALKRGEINYAEESALNLRKYLDKSKQKTGYNLAMAYTAFTRKDYEEALRFLSKTEHLDFHFKLRIKFLYLKIYYYLNLIEEGLSLLDSFKHFVHDTKEIHPDFKKMLNQAIKHHIQLFKFKAVPERVAEEDIRKFIGDVQRSMIMQKQWYIDEAEDLRMKLYGSKRKIL